MDEQTDGDIFLGVGRVHPDTWLEGAEALIKALLVASSHPLSTCIDFLTAESGAAYSCRIFQVTGLADTSNRRSDQRGGETASSNDLQ